MCEAINGTLAVLLAPVCAACEAPLTRVFDGPVCEACWSAIRLVTPPVCRACGVPLARADSAAPRCRTCVDGQGPLGTVRTAGWYDGPLRTLVHAFKYRGYSGLARPLGRLVRARCVDALVGADACVPVPLHWRRRWGRGYNQAALLANELGLPVRPLLRRCRATPSQAGLHADTRHDNVRGAFRPRPFVSRWIRGAVLVLVDDVLTTGSTLDACARVLTAHGAADVRAVTVARAEAPAGRRPPDTPLP